jgi:hypothetical protein
MRHGFRQPGFAFIVGTFALDLHLHCFELERKVKNVDHSDCCSGVVSTWRWRLGVFALAQLGLPATDPGSRFPGARARRAGRDCGFEMRGKW